MASAWTDGLKALYTYLPRPVRYWIEVLVVAARYWSDGQAFIYAAALAFFTVFSIAPVMIVVVTMVGLVLWRGGVVLVVGYVGYFGLRALLTITDAQLELAVAVLLTGVIFVFASVVGERLEDRRRERSDLE